MASDPDRKSSQQKLPFWAVVLAGLAAVLILMLGVLLATMPRAGGPAATVVSGGAVRSTGEAAIGGPFVLTDQTGAAFTEADLAGRPSLIYFGYTFCPDVCPLSLQVMKRAMDEMPEALRAQVRPVFVSVDPERDTVARLAEYVTTPGFPDGLVALTGTVEQVEEAKRVYRIYSARGAQEGDFYLVDHTSLIYLMDSDGRFVAAFGHSESPAAIAQSVRAAL